MAKWTSELEATIEERLIEQLCTGDSQWTHRQDICCEADLWTNFRYILEQNNKARLKDIPLSDSEFEQVKNQISFSSFYDAGKWLVGENGIVQVHVQRGNETLHLVALNNEHISGGTSVYEIINQYQAFRDPSEDQVSSRDRRFDVTLMINGIPLIHIELKNRQHSYMDGFRQIKKYVGEGKFKGLFSAVQMFVVSNAVDTRYFSAARDTELNPVFMSGWVDEDNHPVPGLFDFAGKVLKIPEAHEMIARYTVLDNVARRLMLLRPYQIHAIEAMRRASRTGKSGFIWHTTGSGKTMTSYKSTRNLLMDIPALDKTVFLLDRKDLNEQTTAAFQSYAEQDLVDVDETENVTDLVKKLADKDRQMIVTTIQKMQIMTDRRLKEGTPEYDRIKSLRIAFVVDECHRAVTPGTKRRLSRFFANSMWYGFTGTPRFMENAYDEEGDLPRTTEQLYGPCLHKYTIKEAIHDGAVLGFMNEYLADPNIDPKKEYDPADYEKESHMLMVINTIINRSSAKLGLNRGRGQTYEGLLTVPSIRIAQKYYDLFKRVKQGDTPVVISEDIKKLVPDFPKVAITYSVAENADGEQVNDQKMTEAIKDYNEMFGKHFELSQLSAYNQDLNDRLARKSDLYACREAQLDLVIVVDRLLTGFDAPCMSTLFMDRQPMQLHHIIQAFSRTNRIFNSDKTFGQIVTFQSPEQFKDTVDKALKLFSAGGIGDALAPSWEEAKDAFVVALADLRALVSSPEEAASLSKKEKRRYIKLFQAFDKACKNLKAFTNFEDGHLSDYGIEESEVADYAAHYRNIIEELRDTGDDDPDPDGGLDPTDLDYEPLSFGQVKIDYEYILRLMEDIASFSEDDADGDFDEGVYERMMAEAREYVDTLNRSNPKLGELMSQILDELEEDRTAFRDRSISERLSEKKREVLQKAVDRFTEKWFVNRDAVAYAVENHRHGTVPNARVLKESLRYSDYKAAAENAYPKFKAQTKMIAELEELIKQEIMPLQPGYESTGVNPDTGMDSGGNAGLKGQL